MLAKGGGGCQKEPKLCLHTFDSLIDVGIVEYDEGAVPTELESELLERVGALRGEELAHAGLLHFVRCQPPSHPPPPLPFSLVTHIPALLLYKARKKHTEPVKVTFLTVRCLHSASDKLGVLSSVVGSTFSTPLG